MLTVNELFSGIGTQSFALKYLGIPFKVVGISEIDKFADDKIYTGPVWDFDIAFENDNRTHPISQYNDFIYATDDSSAAGGKNMKRFVSRIIKEDPVANAQLKQMWNELRSNGVITEESLIAYIDQTAALLDESQKLNFKRWKILDRKFHMNFQALGSYEAEVNTIKTYIDERLVRLDEFINR